MKELITAIFLVVLIFGCTDDHPFEPAVNHSTDVAEESAIQRDIIDRFSTQIDKAYSAISVIMKEIKMDRSEKRKGFRSLQKAGSSSVIHIPADYPRLQDAIDNASAGDKILVTGSVSDPGDVIVDVPDLEIKGVGGGNTASSIDGSRLLIFASGVEIKNLTIFMGVVISGVSDVSLTNNQIIASEHTPGFVSSGLQVNMSLLLDQSSECLIKNNLVKPNDQAFAIHLGIAINGGNGHRIESCEVIMDHSLIPSTAFYEGIDGRNGAGGIEVIGTAVQGDMSATSFGLFLIGSGNTIFNCTASHVTGTFVVVGDGNEIRNCEARSYNWTGVEVNGNDNIVNHTLSNGEEPGMNSAISRGFASYTGQNNQFEHCEALNNAVGVQLVSAFGPNVENGVSHGKFYQNAHYGIAFYQTDQAHLDKNHVNENGNVGIHLFETSQTLVTKNKAKDNLTCDFNQTGASGTTLSKNKFGTSCAELASDGPF